MTEGQESLRPIGLQCLEDAAQKRLSGIQSLINQLKLESIRIKSQFEAFEQESASLMNEMQQINAELRGGGSQLDNISKDFAKEFTPVCRDIFTAEVLSQGNRSGLLGMKNNPAFIEQYDLANQAYGNESIWRQDLLDKIQNIKTQINRYGPTVLEGGLISDQSDTSLEKSIATAFTKSYLTFKKEYDDIKARTQRTLNYTLPPLDQNFAQSISNFSQSSDRYFKKKLIDECMMGEKYNLAIAPEKILQGIKQSNASTRGTNIFNYQNQLKQILEQDSFFEDKIAAIRRLDEVYGGNIVYTYRDFNEGLVSKPPSEIYRSTLAICEKQIQQDNTFARNPSQDSNNPANIEQTTRDLQDLARKSQTFTTDITNDIFERVANCDGNVLKSGSCNNKTLNPNEAGFCIAHAASCSNAIRNCHQDLDNKIALRTNSLKALANRWDDSAKVFIAQQKNYFNERFLAPTIMMTEQIRQHLPGAAINYSADTFVKSPLPEQHPQFGIDMIGGGDLRELKQLPALIEENIIGMLEEQKQKLDDEYKRYAQGKRDSINSDLERWRNLKDNCENLESKIANTIEKINNEKMTGWSEQMQSATDFCVKYDALRQNPAAGCDTLQELFNDSIRVSGMINPNVNIELNKFAAYCSQYNNEKDEDVEEDGDDNSLSTLKNICEDHGNSFDDARGTLEDMAITTVPSEYHDEALRYLQNQQSSPELISQLDGRQRLSLKRIHGLIHPSKNRYDITHSVVKDLLSDGITTKGEVYQKIQSDSLKGWEGLSEPLTIADLSKMAKLPENQRKELFPSADSAKKIIDYMVESNELNSQTDNLCAKHMNYALYEAAQNCAKKDYPGNECVEDELQETAWNRYFSGIEQNLSRLNSLSKTILAQELGEQAQSSCIAPMGNEPRQQKPSIEDFLFPDGGSRSPSRDLDCEP